MTHGGRPFCGVPITVARVSYEMNVYHDSSMSPTVTEF